MKARQALIALVLALGLASCGGSATHHVGNAASGAGTGGGNGTDVGANNNGSYASAGNITYQLEVSRELNQYDTEDSQYLAGVPPADRSLKPDELWYGVFLWARNETSAPKTTTSSFDIVDTQGIRYYPVPLSASANPYAWTAQTLAPNGTEPALDTTASYGPTQGRLLLFKLNTSVYSNRPLTLEIYAAGQSKPTTISLDL